MNASLLSLLVYIIGAIVGLLLAAWLVSLVLRERVAKGDTLLARYVRYAVDQVLGPPPRHANRNRFLLYGLVAILIAGWLIGLSDPTQARGLAQSAFPWMVLVFILIALIGFVRWAKSQ